MQLYESRLSYFNDKARINYCKSPSVHQHGGRSRPRQNCHSCIFETNENSNLRICIQYLGHHSKTTCQKSAKSMRYRVRPKFEFYRKSLLRASFCKYRESGDSFKIYTFFIFCPNKAFSELFSKIQLKDPKALEFFQNRGKFGNRHLGLPPPLKIDKNDAFSFRSCW